MRKNERVRYNNKNNDKKEYEIKIRNILKKSMRKNEKE